MASGQSSECHAGEAEHKKRRVGTPDRDYHSLLGEPYVEVSPDLPGGRILAGQGYQRQHYPSTNTISSNDESRNDSFNTRQTYFPPQITHGVPFDPMGTASQGLQDYHSQRYLANQSIPSDYERQSDSNVPLQMTQEHSRNPIRSRFQAWPDHTRQVETQTIQSLYGSQDNSFNTRQPGQMPHGISSDPMGTSIQAGQDYEGQHYASNQSVPVSYESQGDPFNTRQSNLQPQITEGKTM
ncbi:uncharacterized protein [Ptychodera flava]|uniref:uncharacterized protein n=1 Tax=Ptychodera flava TaxID=63121 RepID=UPI00396A47B6